MWFFVNDKKHISTLLWISGKQFMISTSLALYVRVRVSFCDLRHAASCSVLTETWTCPSFTERCYRCQASLNWMVTQATHSLSSMSLFLCFSTCSLRRWSTVRWTQCSRSSSHASLLSSLRPSPALPPLLPPLPPLPPPLPLFLKLHPLPKKQDSASEDGLFSGRWIERKQRMTVITDLLFWQQDDDYADDDLFFFDTCIIFASLPSHSATSLGAVLLYVQCVCFPAGFGVILCVFLFSRLLQFLENQGRDITSDFTRLTTKTFCHISSDTTEDLSCPLVAGLGSVLSILHCERQNWSWPCIHILYSSHLFHLDRFKLCISYFFFNYVIHRDIYRTSKCSKLKE